MKTMYFSAVLTLILSVLPGGAFSQDIIYKTDGTLMHVDIVTFDGKTVKYRLPGDQSGKILYMSSSVIDSLKDDSKGTVTFPKHTVPVNRISRNYIGTDLFNTLFQNPNLTYERLSASGSTSFSVELLINLNNGEYYGAVWDYWRFTHNVFLNYDPFYFFTKFGYTYYPYNYSLNRTRSLRPYTGASVLVGQFRKREYDNYYYETFSKKFAFAISWNFGAKLYLANRFLVKADFELSLIPFLVLNSPELGFEIGF
jgi:hypothetical protein